MEKHKMSSDDTLLRMLCRNRALTKLKGMHPEDFEVLYKAELKQEGIKRPQDMTKAEKKETEITRLKNKLKELQE